MTVQENRTLPAGWLSVKLGDVANFIMGQAPPGSECNRDGKGAVFVKAGEFGSERPIVREWTTQPLKFASEGDVLICVVGATAGKLNRGIDCAIGRSVAAIRPRGGILAAFVLYQLVPQVLALRAASAGSAQGVISRADLGKIPFSLAPLAEQARIVEEIESRMSRIDAAGLSLRRVRPNLKRYRAAVLKAACEGRFVPTEAVLAGRESRAYESADVLLARILDYRRARWEADELERLRASGKGPKDGTWKQRYRAPSSPGTQAGSALPEGWTWATVDQLSELVEYGSSSKTSADQEGVPVLRMGNIVDGQLVFGDLKYLPQTHPEFPKLLLQSGDVLFNRTNSPELVGKTAVFAGESGTCSFASYLIRVRLLPGVEPRYLSYFINSPSGRAWVSTVVTQQVGQANVNGTKLKELVIPLPPAEEQKRIVAEVDRVLSLAKNAAASANVGLTRADRLRQSILKKAFEGKLVPQDPNDEPASILLERIRTSRAEEKKLASKPKKARPTAASAD